MKQKIILTAIVALTLTFLMILLIGLSADTPELEIADRSGGRGANRAGPSQGGRQHTNAPQRSHQPPQQQPNRQPRQQQPQRSHQPPQQTRPQPHTEQRHQPPQQQPNRQPQQAPRPQQQTQQQPQRSHQQTRSQSEIPQVSRSPSMSRSVQRAPEQRPHMPPAQSPSPTKRPSQQTTGHAQNQQRRQPQQHNIQARQETRQYIQQKNSSINNAPSSFQPPTPVTSSIIRQQQVLSEKADRARNVIHQRNPKADRWFDDRFFEEHNCRPYYHNQGDNWWWAPSWVGVSSWLPWGWDSAYYYSDSGYAYTMPPESYELPSDQYITPPQEEWMPLGVFAAGETYTEAAYSSMFVQLALNKSGQIAGTYYNTATNEVHDLDGEVNEYTQEAVWKVSDNPNSPTMITGLYNLTQDVAIVQVLFTNGRNQNWTLVRIHNSSY